MMKSYVNVSDTEKRPIEKSGDDLILGAVVPRHKPAPSTPSDVTTLSAQPEGTVLPTPAPRSTVDELISQEDKGITPSRSALIDPALQEYGDQTAILRGDFYALVVPVTPRMEPEGYWSAIARSLTETWFHGTRTNWFSGDIFADLEYPTSYVDVALHHIVNTPSLDLYTLFTQHADSIISLVNDGLRVVVVRDSGAPQSVSLEFTDYLNPERTFSAWLSAMSTGARGIPLPILLALLETFDLHSKADVLEYIQRQVSVEDARGMINDLIR